MFNGNRSDDMGALPAQFDSVQVAYTNLVRYVLRFGAESSPRGQATRESLDCYCRILEPRRRLVVSSARAWDLYYALGEMLWHFSGSNDLNVISYYSRAWRHFSENGRTVEGSAYGHHIFGINRKGVSQWSKIQELLKADPDTRRAVIVLADPLADVDSANVDVSCCCLLHFMLREGCLNLKVYMRSNDLWIGFGYDVFLFTSLQERMALEIDAKLGWYDHNVGSLHLYQKHFDRATLMAREDVDDKGDAMQSMDHLDQLNDVLELERRIRIGELRNPDAGFGLSPYWENVVLALLFYRSMLDEDKRAMGQISTRLQSTSFFQLLTIRGRRTRAASQ